MAVYTVSQVSFHIKDSLESDPLLMDLWVVGEVSSLRSSSAGHTYFSLKDRDSILRCVMFRGHRGAELLSEGDSISAHGKVSFYTRGGSTDFMVDLAMPEGVGELALELERLKQKLDGEGLFETGRKRPLQRFPKRVGVVTSATGAVFYDIQNVIRRRYPLTELVLSPTAVQGVDAAPKIVAALELLDREGNCDVIIIGRGGGSMEALWPFNAEVVDETISDFVADLRAPTPSAAAELVVPDSAVLRRSLNTAANDLYRVLVNQNAKRRSDLMAVAQRMEMSLPDTQSLRRRIDDVGQLVHAAASRLVSHRQMQVEGINLQLRALDPVATMRRGFSIVYLPDIGHVVSKSKQVSDGDALEITLAEGSVSAVAGTLNEPANQTPQTTEIEPSAKPKGVHPKGMAPLL